MTLLLPDNTSAHVFLRSEALDAGYTDRQIGALVKTHEWHRIRRGAYVAGPLWRDADGLGRHALRARAVVRQSKTDVVLSHVSSLPTYEAPTYGISLDDVHLTRPDGRAGRAEAGVRQHRGRLVDGDVVERDGLAVTSATRTALDMTTVAGPEAALCVVNHLLHAGSTSLEKLTKRYASMERNPFTLATDLVLRLADPRIESVGESRTYFMCWRQGLPAPQPQWVITDRHGRELARLDFAWPEQRTWLEFDGREKYVKFLREGESVTDAVLREKRREEMIAEATGWRCIRIIWADLADPARTASRVRQLFASSAA